MGEVVNIGDYRQGDREKRIEEIQDKLTVYKARIKINEEELSGSGAEEYAEANRRELEIDQENVKALTEELERLQKI